MNHNRIFKLQKSLRFRRWNRAGYAVFASLAGVVTIGVLTSSISEKSLDKSENSYQNLNSGFISTFNFDDDEPLAAIVSLSDANMLSEQYSVILYQSSDSAAACVPAFYNPS